MKLLIALAVFVVLAYAAEEVQLADNSADLSVDEHRWAGCRGYHGGYYHSRPHYYGGYNGYHRGRRSAAVEIPQATEDDQSAQEHRYGGYGGYYGGYYRPGYGGYRYGRPYWG